MLRQSLMIYDHILLHQTRDPHLEGQVHYFVPPQEKVAQLYPRSAPSTFLILILSFLKVAFRFAVVRPLFQRQLSEGASERKKVVAVEQKSQNEKKTGVEPANSVHDRRPILFRGAQG
jgi:hypothetical protein